MITLKKFRSSIFYSVTRIIIEVEGEKYFSVRPYLEKEAKKEVETSMEARSKG